MDQRIYYFDFLNIIACIAVLALHHNGIVHSFDSTSNWNQALFIEVSFYWAVPIFFMLSGATLMDYKNRYSTKQFLIQRFKRTFLPFIIQSLFWAALRYYWTNEIPSLFDLVYKVFHTEYQNVYWFFIPLFGIYLLLPAIQQLKYNRNILNYISIILFINEGLLMPLYKILNINPIGGENTLAGPMLFFIIGYMITNNGNIINNDENGNLIM